MTCNVSSGMIYYVITFCVMLDSNLCSMMYLGQVTHLLSLRLRIPKSGKGSLPWIQHILGTDFPLSHIEPLLRHYPAKAQNLPRAIFSPSLE